MKCLCFSDSHGSTYGMIKALKMHPDAEVVFFLGDGLSDFDQLIYDKKRAWLAVRGNCDYSAVLGNDLVKKTDSITIEGVRIVFTHGDLYGVKYGTDGIMRLAEETKADIILFGHTHQPLESYISNSDKPYYLFNPGSIGGGFSSRSTYGVINISEKGILLSHGMV